jgi:hypothetical protein
MRTSTFMPTPKELLDAMNAVKDRIPMCIHQLSEWLKRMDKADQFLFRLDRPAWDAAHASSEDVLKVLQCLIIEKQHERRYDVDDDRYQVLNQMSDARNAAKRIEQTVETLRIAACKTPPAKRTHKSKTPCEARPEADDA